MDTEPAGEAPEDTAIIDLRDRQSAAEPSEHAPTNPELTTAATVEADPSAIVTDPADVDATEIISEPEAGVADSATAATDRFDIRAEEVGSPASEARHVTAAPQRPHNPFRRLILWSVVLGLGLLVVAGVMLVT